MANIYDQFDTPVSGNVYDQFDAPSTPQAPVKQNKGALGDAATDVKIGLEQLPGSVTGLGDVAYNLGVAAPAKLAGLDIGGRPFDTAATWLGDKTGFKPAQWAKDASKEYSPQRQAAEQEINEAWDNGSAGDIAKSYLTNPGATVGRALQSAPSMLAGGIAGRGLRVAAGVANPFIAEGLGEAAVTAGQNMDQTDRSADPIGAAAANAAAGAITGAIGGASGKVASKLGIRTIENTAVGGIQTAENAALNKWYKRIPAGMAQEGLLEELPQSMQEQIWQNVAEGKPWHEGVMRQGVEGALAGGVMGGGMNVLPAKKAVQQDTPHDVLSGLDVGETADMFGGAGALPEQQTPRYNDAGDEGAEVLVGRNRRQMEMEFDNGTPYDVLYGGAHGAMFTQEPITDAGMHANRDLFEGIHQDIPLPTDIGSAVSALQQIGFLAHQVGGHVLENSPEHAALLEAQRILRENGMSHLAAIAPQIAGTDQAATTQQPTKQAKTGTKAALKADLDQKLASGAITQEQHIDATNAVDTSRTYAKAKAGVESALRPQAPAGNGLVTETKLTAKQQPVFDHMVQAMQDGRMDDVVDAQGVIQYQKIADATGIKRGSAKSFIDHIVKRIAKANGTTVEELKAALRERATQTRETEAATEDKLGLSPAMQDSQVNHEDLFGSEGGAESNMQIINSVGGSSVGTIDGEKVETPPGYVDSVEPSENTVRHAEQERSLPNDEWAVRAYKDHRGDPVRQVDIADALDEWSELDGTELPQQYHMQWTLAYIANMDGVLNGRHFQEIYRSILADIQRQATETTGAAADVVPEGSGRPQLDAGATVEGDARRVDEHTAPSIEASPGSDQQGEEALTPQNIAQAWNAGIEGSTIPTFPHLTDEERQWLLGATDEDSLNQRAQEVADGYLAKFSKVAATSPTESRFVVTPAESRFIRSGSFGEYLSDFLKEVGAKWWQKPDVSVFEGELIVPAQDVALMRKFADWLADTPENRGDIPPQMRDGTFFKELGKARSPSDSSTADAVNGVVNELVGKSHPRIKVVQSVDELTPAERQAAERDAGRQLSQDEWGQVQAFVVGGKAYFIAGNIPAGAERAVFLHEIGAHLGLEKLLTKEQFKRLVRKIEEWAARNDDSQESKVAKAALERVAEAGDHESLTDSEKVAYFVEEAVKAGIDPTAVKYNSELGRWFRQLWAAFKTAIRRLTGEANFAKFNAQDVVNLAYGAAKLELTGTWHGTAADFRNFNHEYMGSGEGAQAYGWGTYLAQRVGIAKGYWEADVRRKKRTSTWGGIASDFIYDGKVLPQVTPDTTDAEVVARLITAVYSQGMVNNRSATTIESVYGVDADVAEKAAEIAKTLDVTKGDMRQSRQEGSLMRADVNVRDNEMLDWDKPLSEQSELVKKALTENMKELVGRHPANSFADWGGSSGRELYQHTESVFGSDKAASEYLDSIGIKGIKFLDSQSRGVKNRAYYQGEIAKLQEKLSDVKSQIAFAESVGKPTSALYIEKNQVEDLLWRTKQQLAKTPESETRNLVIFNDKNIQRVATEVGADRERVKFSKAAQQKFIDEHIPEPYQESATRIAGTVRDLLKRGTYAVAFGHDLADMVRPILPSAKNYFDLMSQKGATMTKLESNIDAIMERSSKVKDRAALNKFIADSTMSGKWGYKIDPNSKAVIDPEMERRFKALSPEAQQIAKDIFKHGYETVNKLRNMIRAEIEAGEKEGVPKEDVLRQLRLLDEKFPAMSGPYAPLSRFGNYVVVGKSAAFVDAVKNNDQKWIDANESDPNHYYVEFFDSQGQADVAKRRVQRKYAEVTAAAKQSEAVRAEAPWSIMRRLGTQIDNEFGKNSKESAKLRGLLNDLYLSTLTESSARQHYQSRRKVAGYTPDMLRSFASKGRADAYFMSSLEYTGQVSDALAAMRSEAKEEGKPELREDRTRALNEVLKRHAASMDYRPSPIMDKLASGTGMWMLLTNPAYYFQNSLQPFMMTLPWLAGKHGYAKSWGALMGAYRAISKGGLDIDKMNISDAERTMLHNLRDNGILDIGIQRELGHWMKDGNEGALSKGMSTVAFKLNTAVQKLEMVNRITSALAAYRLSGSEKDAADTIRITHGDYGSFNAPRPFKAPAAKLLLQFRKFQLIQLSMLARMAKGIFAGSKPGERATAAKMLWYTMAHHFAMTGFLGLPAANLIGMAVTAALGSGDDPKDEEYLLRKWIDNEDISNLLLKGIPAVLGVDISTKVGMGNVTSVLPFSKADPLSRQGFSDTMFQLLGPAAALGQRFADGAGLMRQGDYWKGLEQMVPSGVSNGMKGIRQATEGVTLRNGDRVLTPDEYGLWNGLLQGLGMTSTDMGQRMRRQGDAIQFSKDFMAHATELKHRYTEAYKAGDGESLSEIRTQWRELQDAERRNGFKASPMSDLVKAPVEQRKRERMSIEGVEAKKNNRQFVRTDASI